MLAAVQAPIIMMSQNRQAAKDRIEAQRDYDTNLRSEVGILTAHEKLDRVLARLDRMESGRLGQAWEDASPDR